MMDDDHRIVPMLSCNAVNDDLCMDRCGSNGIARYLRTMHAVAHTPGMRHWCTPGHNRGKALDALSLDMACASVAETSAFSVVQRGLRREESHD